MNLTLFKTLWGHDGPITDACRQAVEANFQGLEGQAPADPDSQKIWQEALASSGLEYIGEVVTGGDYVPAPGRSVERHLDDLKQGIEHAWPLNPLFITTLCGSDRWPFADVLDFHARILDLESQTGIPISVETHRSRCTFSPWQTRAIAESLPELKFTCDFSHWCVVTERLIMEEEPGLLDLLASRFHHIHARVGYAQGPQVPHPAAGNFRCELEAHLRWWRVLWRAAISQGRPSCTMTPEFGPDGYLHHLPFTDAPVGDLWEINQWMGARVREEFEQL